MNPALLCFAAAFTLFAAPSVRAAAWWPASTAKALAAAGDNQPELARALAEVPAAQRGGMQFLIENMPPVDLATLKAGFLLGHVAQAYAAMESSPWVKLVPEEVFFNDVLPYACLNERRDNSRARLRDIAAPLVEGCKTPGEAGRALNEKLFGRVGVKYSTKRKKPDQSAIETMESGIATCSGLSILLVEACRSVGVPARVAGTPLWTNLRGNHTWVEIWDQGTWHFAGAAEPDGKGLDHGWFQGDAAAADDTRPEHRIYASSFRKTGTAFPLVWDLSIDWVPAVNVTSRYTAGAKKPEPDRVRFMVRVLDRPEGRRVAAKVTATDAADPAQTFSGTSSGDTADLNNILPFQLIPGHQYHLEVDRGGQPVRSNVTVSRDAEQITTVILHP